MHIEFLIEDVSGKKFLDVLVPKLIGAGATYNIHSYKGVGRIPKGLKGKPDPSRRILLDNLPRLLSGYGRAFDGYGRDYKAAVVVVCDLDNKSRASFTAELNSALAKCHPEPRTFFCLAIEEGESWLLGDRVAIKKAFPNAKDSVLKAYVNDSICGTWETLADAIYIGGSKSLQAQPWYTVGQMKSIWAEKIAPHMDVSANMSPSFIEFRDVVSKLAVS